MTVPAGSCTWGGTWTYPATAPVYIPTAKKITLQGAGIGTTTITGDTRNGNLLDIQSSGSRVKGFTFVTGKLTASGQDFRIDHNRFEVTCAAFMGSSTIGTDMLNITGKSTTLDTRGVIDHNQFYNTRVLVSGGPSLLNNPGWLRPLTLGDENAVFVEDNTFESSCDTIQAHDGNYGGRSVFRYNTVNDASVMAHAVHTINRAQRSWEVYNNTYIDTRNCSACENPGMAYLRAGTGVVFNNELVGDWGTHHDVEVDVRKSCENLPPFANPPTIGRCYGGDWWDGNEAISATYDSSTYGASSPLGTGTHTGAANAATLTDSTKAWTVNSMTYSASVPTRPYTTVWNTTKNEKCQVTANDATSVTCTLSNGADWDFGDAYKISYGYPCRDQLGRSTDAAAWDKWAIETCADNGSGKLQITVTGHTLTMHSKALFPPVAYGFSGCSTAGTVFSTWNTLDHPILAVTANTIDVDVPYTGAKNGTAYVMKPPPSQASAPVYLWNNWLYDNETQRLLGSGSATRHAISWNQTQCANAEAQIKEGRDMVDNGTTAKPGYTAYTYPHPIITAQDGGITYYTMTVSKDGTGSGIVTSNTGAINCGATCSDQYESTASVILTASTSGNNTFVTFTGSGCTTSPCTAAMSQARAVTATFNDTTPTNFLVQKIYVGSGTTSPDEGFDAYASGATATTTQAPSANYTFSAWSGTCGCTGAGACAPTITADCTIIATWIEDTKYTFTITPGAGVTRVASDVGPIDCGGNQLSCYESFYSGTILNLAAECDTYWGNPIYTGDCSGTTCSPTMTAAKAVGASCEVVSGIGVGPAVRVGTGPSFTVQ